MFANTQMTALNLAFPDVCKTPIVVPVPIPYPNISLSSWAIPNVFNQFIMCMPIHNMGTTVPVSVGDDAGVLLGLAMPLVKGPTIHIQGSVKVFRGVMPATKMLCATAQNGGNMIGATLSPSQAKVLYLS
ncbi:MAG: DUF4150 domain-containing protein [Cellvibrionaceae bacterium]|nr:DUF4150 domain-containing protein [Cellvibrionaceae bacterium]